MVIREIQNERGGIIIFCAVSLLILLASLAFIYDLGASYLARQSFQSSVDRALTSAIHLKWLNPDTPVDSLLSVATSTCEANLERLPFLRYFSSQPACNLTIGGTVDDPEMEGRISGDMGTTFMRLLGTNSLHVWANRKAVFKGGAYPVVPIIIVGSEHADRAGDFDYDGVVSESDLNAVRDIERSEVRSAGNICGQPNVGEGRVGLPPSMVYRTTDLDLNGIFDAGDVARTFALTGRNYNLLSLPKEEEQDMGIRYALTKFVDNIDINDSRIAILNSSFHAHTSISNECILGYNLLNSFYLDVGAWSLDFYANVISSTGDEEYPVPVLEDGFYYKGHHNLEIATKAGARTGCGGFFLQGSLLRVRKMIANLFSGQGEETIDPRERDRYNVFVIVLNKGIEYSYLWHPLTWSQLPEPEAQHPFVRPKCNFSRDPSWTASPWSPNLGDSGDPFPPIDKRPSCTGQMTYSSDRPEKGGRGQSGIALAIQIADQLRELDGATVYSVCTGCTFDGCLWNYSSTPYDACSDQLRFARIESLRRLAYDRDWLGLSEQGGVVFYNTSSLNLISGEVPTCQAWYQDPYSENPSRPEANRKTAYTTSGYSGVELEEVFLKILEENQGGRLIG